MSVFSVQGVLEAGDLGHAFSTARIYLSGGQLVIHDELANQSTVLDLSGGTLAEIAGSLNPSGGDISVQWPLTGTLHLNQNDLANLVSSGSTTSTTLYSDQTGLFGDAVTALAITEGTQTIIVLGHAASQGVASFVFDGATLEEVTAVTDTNATYLQGVSTITTAVVGNKTYVFAAGALDHGVTSYELSQSGQLIQRDTLGYEEYLPAQTPQAMDTVTLQGRTFIIVASAASSSLTVLEVGSNGALNAVDQIIDDLNTRFSGVQAMDVFMDDGRAYVLVAGMDDGLSLFTILPNGRLVHIETMADTTSAGLSNISALEVVEVQGSFQAFATSSSEHGVTQIDLSLNTPGITAIVSGTYTANYRGDILIADDDGVTLDARHGDDIIVDGAGLDYLTGGGGADHFILTADTHQDVILDYERGKDSLDLSSWGYIRNVGQLTFASQSDGVIISFGDHSVRLYSHDGRALQYWHFSSEDVLNATHVDLSFVRSPVVAVQTEFFGTAQDDLIAGNDTDDRLVGLAGDDLLQGGEGADQLEGGSGVDLAAYGGDRTGVFASLEDPSQNTGNAAGDSYDSIEGFSGSAFNDELIGNHLDNEFIAGRGDDVVRARAGDDVIQGNTGHDWLDGGDGNDELHGGTGNDALLGRSGNDTLYGGDGNDNIAAHDGDDIVYGGAGHDQLGGSYGNDTMFGGTGNDVIGSGAQNDYIDAGDGNDVASGGWGEDVVLGGDGDDVLAGSYGVDRVEGGAGNDSLGGGQGNDQLFGGDGDDLLGAGDDDDRLWGGNGRDFLGGGSGHDRLYGDAGNDTLNGGNGWDRLTGGDGRDVFVFNTFVDGEIDTITDFVIGDDRMRLKSVEGTFDGLDIWNVTVGSGQAAQVKYDGHKIRLLGVDANDLDVEDFIFLL